MIFRHHWLVPSVGNVFSSIKPFFYVFDPLETPPSLEMTSTQEHEAENPEIPIIPVNHEQDANGSAILAILAQRMEAIIQKFDIIAPLCTPSPPLPLHDEEVQVMNLDSSHPPFESQAEGMPNPLRVQIYLSHPKNQYK